MGRLTQKELVNKRLYEEGIATELSMLGKAALTLLQL